MQNRQHWRKNTHKYKNRRPALHGSEVQHSILIFLSSFSCCALIFGAIALTVLRSVNGWRGLFFGIGAKQTAAVPKTSFSASNSFTMLIGVHEGDGAPVEFMLLRLDTACGEEVILPLPSALSVTGYAGTGKGAHTLGGIYQNKGIADTKAAVQALFGIPIDKTCDISSGNFVKLFALFGGLYGTVPEPIDFTLPDGSSRMHLSASSTQYLDGKRLYALIAYSSYKGGVQAQMKEQGTLMKAFIRQKLTESYLCDPYRYYGPAFNLVSTDFSICDLLNTSDALATFSGSETVRVLLPVCRTRENGLVSVENRAAVRQLFG